MSRPHLLIDARIPDAPLTPLADLAEVLRYENQHEVDRYISMYGNHIVGIAPLLTTPIDAGLLDRLPNLRMVAVYAVGVDNVDLDAARDRGVVVTHTPDVLTEATADLTWALILAVARRLREGERLARSGEWEGWHPRQLLGKELHGATLGILGLGRIGAAVARRGVGFGMEVVYWSRSAKPEPEANLGAARLAFEELLERADVVSIHLPLTDETRHLIDAAALARMKPDAILVNTARGPIVDEAALAAALSAGRLFGAGLDVFEEEPGIHPGLIASDRTVLLPHLGSATVAARDAMARCVAGNLAAALRGEPPLTPVGSR
ncbi:MAG TPA: D-glycerate dehydrogenase [Gemmatimonadota bacterium]|nr:D-glycerate dehydrogenase [Gemmatimonadota bacterium]